jgi:hypothetical protein
LRIAHSSNRKPTGGLLSSPTPSPPLVTSALRSLSRATLASGRLFVIPKLTHLRTSLAPSLLSVLVSARRSRRCGHLGPGARARRPRRGVGLRERRPFLSPRSPLLVALRSGDERARPRGGERSASPSLGASHGGSSRVNDVLATGRTGRTFRLGQECTRFLVRTGALNEIQKSAYNPSARKESEASESHGRPSRHPELFVAVAFTRGTHSPVVGRTEATFAHPLLTEVRS